jgi:hypothetical protein
VKTKARILRGVWLATGREIVDHYQKSVSSQEN